MRLLVATALLVLGLAAPAGATVVTWVPAPPDTSPTPEESCSRYSACPPPSIIVTGEGAENNDIEAGATADGRIVIRDRGATIRSTECSPEEGGGVSCPSAGDLTMRLGDGDDRAAAPGWIVDAGAGNDTVTGTNVDGGPGDDVLTGTELGDTLTAGPGRDTVRGGAGPDTIAEGEATPEADVLDGGDGNDQIQFAGRVLPVLVDLASAGAEVAGTAGEGNAVSAFEEALGGDGADTLLGSFTAAPETGSLSLDLLGGKGDDRIVDRSPGAYFLGGGPGDDELAGGPAPTAAPFNDELVGGTGNDRISGGRGTEALRGESGDDRIAAGAGDDEVTGGLGADRLDGGPGNDNAGGGDGNDRVLGGAGRDVLSGGRGRDLLFGGTGNDRLTTSGDRRTPDRASCGSGTDVLKADARDRATGCETIRPKRRG